MDRSADEVSWGYVEQLLDMIRKQICQSYLTLPLSVPDHPHGEDRPDEGYGYEGEEWEEDEDLATQLNNAYTAMAAEAALDSLDEVDATYAESVQLASEVSPEARSFIVILLLPTGKLSWPWSSLSRRADV
eukprot:s3587_g3.t1